MTKIKYGLREKQAMAVFTVILLGGISVAVSVVSVSYTHLDVYKRQVYTSIWRLSR